MYKLALSLTKLTVIFCLDQSHYCKTKLQTQITSLATNPSESKYLIKTRVSHQNFYLAARFKKWRFFSACALFIVNTNNPHLMKEVSF
jgi:hypothetical protein